MSRPVHFALAHKQATACGFRLSYNSDRILATYDPAKVTCEVCMRSSAFRKENLPHPTLTTEQKA